MKNIMKIRLVALGLPLTMTVVSIGPALANPTAFTDVPTDFWAYEQINRCVQDGIVSGYNDGTFKPGNPVSYGAFSIMLARAFYSDELAGYANQSTATGEAIMNKHGILNGTSRSSKSIGDPLPREDMAQCMSETPVTPPETPEVTDGPLFKLQDGETAQQMMNRINASTTYREGYLTNGKPITEESIC